jgi:hypothetical protein
MTGPKPLHDVLKCPRHGLFQWMAAALRQLKAYESMVRAGREIEAVLRREARSGAPRADHHDLLRQSYARHGVDLGDAERPAEPTVEDCLALARAELQAARWRLTREIAGYPTPIAGCDCQFNHLLSVRAKIAGALAALDRDLPSPKRA